MSQTMLRTCMTVSFEVNAYTCIYDCMLKYVDNSRNTNDKENVFQNSKRIYSNAIRLSAAYLPLRITVLALLINFLNLEYKTLLHKTGAHNDRLIWFLR